MSSPAWAAMILARVMSPKWCGLPSALLRFTGGNFDALMSLLDPNIVLRADRRALGPSGPAEIRDAAAIAERAVKAGARAAQPALIDGDVGVIVAPRGKLLMVLKFTVADGKIVEMEAIADRDHLRQLDLAVLG